ADAAFIPNRTDLHAANVARLDEALNEPRRASKPPEALRALVEEITPLSTPAHVAGRTLELRAILDRGAGSKEKSPQPCAEAILGITRAPVAAPITYGDESLEIGNFRE